MKIPTMAACAFAAVVIGWLAPDAPVVRFPAALAQPAPMADGEVRRIDKQQAKVTLRHGPIPSLDMGPMSMVFRVKDPTMLDRLKVGQKIRFEAAKVDGELTLMRFEPAP